MDGVFALVVPVNEDIKIVPGFGRNCDKLLIAAEIVNKGRVPLRRKGCGFFGFLIDNAAVVGRVSGGLLRRLCKSSNGKAAHEHKGGAKCSQRSKDFLIHSRCPPVLRHSLWFLRERRQPCRESRRRTA